MILVNQICLLFRFCLHFCSDGEFVRPFLFSVILVDFFIYEDGFSFMAKKSLIHIFHYGHVRLLVLWLWPIFSILSSSPFNHGCNFLPKFFLILQLYFFV